MNKNTRALSQLLIAFCLGTLSHTSTAADVTVIPPSGSGLAVRDSGDTIDRFRVNEAGTVLIPGLGSATAQGTVTCFNSATGQLGPCSGSLMGPAGPAGPVGPAGPTGATGPSGPAGPAGAMGPTGATGAAGPAGAAGAGVLSGTGSPVAGVGNNGDFYIDTTTSVLFGPKTSGAWPSSGVSLIGPAGVAGPTGPTGAVGATGPVGPAGPTGAAGSTGPTGATGPAGPAGFAGSTSITPSPGAASTDVEQTASASCSTAGRLTGGGCFPNITASDYLNSMYYMYGFPADSTTWVCVYRNSSGNSVTARAICAP